MKTMMDKLLGEASKYLDKGKEQTGRQAGSSSDLLKGALGGGVVGALLGNKKTRKLAKKYGTKAAAVGGTALVGTLAYQAYKKWQQDDEAAPNLTSVSEPVFQQQLDDKAGLLLQAMVFAAKADGHIDEQERAAIAKWVAGQQLDLDSEAAILRWVDAPLDPNALSQQVDNMALASEVYLVSLLTVDVDHFLERAYLDELAKALSLPDELVTRIEEQAEV
ncbi:tellurite resistance TerB family protein [Photobacterium satsumensis]|uniref:tellurite resistance TerB family protein n=1 Tax=Photobacterium satsumensis TaxID=2910239 RepID=UPI003D0C8D3E